MRAELSSLVTVTAMQNITIVCKFNEAAKLPISRMLQSILRDYEQQLSKKKDKIKSAEKKLIDASGKSAKEIAIDVNLPVKHAYANQKKCDKEFRKIQAEANELEKQSEKWNDSLNNFESAIRHLGDFEGILDFIFTCLSQPFLIHFSSIRICN